MLRSADTLRKNTADRFDRREIKTVWPGRLATRSRDARMLLLRNSRRSFVRGGASSTAKTALLRHARPNCDKPRGGLPYPLPPPAFYGQNTPSATASTTIGCFTSNPPPPSPPLISCISWMEGGLKSVQVCWRSYVSCWVPVSLKAHHIPLPWNDAMRVFTFETRLANGTHKV